MSTFYEGQIKFRAWFVVITLAAVGWGCFEMGFGRKVDPEPGRCRRTDGKKWRCSKEAYPDSKYCERHMHRGRNRSRKPVEVSSATSTATNTSQTIPSYTRNLSLTNPTITSPSFPFSPLPSSLSCDSQAFSQSYQNPSLNPFFYAQSTSSRPPDSDFPPQDATTHQLFMDSGSYSHDEKDYRYVFKEILFGLFILLLWSLNESNDIWWLIHVADLMYGG